MPRATSRPPTPSIAGLCALAVALIVAACGTATPPAGSPASGGPSASPIASPSAGTSGTDSQAPDSDSAAAVDAFLAFIETQQTFHLSADIQMTVAGKAVDMDVISDVGKAAEKGFIDIRGAGVSVHLELILVDKILYIRPAQRDWQAIPVETTGANPLADLRSDDLVPLDRVNVAGTLTHHLHVADARGQVNAQTLSGNTLTDLVLDTATFDVYVTDDGVPLTAIYAFAGTGAFAGVPAPITAKIRYDFTKFGQDVSIVPPPGVSPPP